MIDTVTQSLFLNKTYVSCKLILIDMVCLVVFTVSALFKDGSFYLSNLAQGCLISFQ